VAGGGGNSWASSAACSAEDRSGRRVIFPLSRCRVPGQSRRNIRAGCRGKAHRPRVFPRGVGHRLELVPSELSSVPFSGAFCRRRISGPRRLAARAVKGAWFSRSRERTPLTEDLGAVFTQEGQRGEKTVPQRTQGRGVWFCKIYRDWLGPRPKRRNPRSRSKKAEGVKSGNELLALYWTALTSSHIRAR
jgi:hypothetical protein